MTTLIRHRKYAWKDVDPSGLQLVKRAVEVRVGPNDYVRDPRVRTAIGIYAVKSGNHVDVVGRVDPTRLYSQPLTFDVGDGTAGAYPLCGSLSANLGWEAVVAWRRLHDAEQLHKDTLKNRRQFEKFEQERLANARLSRARRRTNRRADETA